MGFIKVEGIAAGRAAPGAVFSLLRTATPGRDGRCSTEIKQAGKDEPCGVGDIRVFSTSITQARAQVMEVIADQQLSYVLLSGLAPRNYRADVRLTSTGGEGALVDWTASFQCLNGIGWFWRLFHERRSVRHGPAAGGCEKFEFRSLIASRNEPLGAASGKNRSGVVVGRRAL